MGDGRSDTKSYVSNDLLITISWAGEGLINAMQYILTADWIYLQHGVGGRYVASLLI